MNYSIIKEAENLVDRYLDLSLIVEAYETNNDDLLFSLVKDYAAKYYTARGNKW